MDFAADNDIFFADFAVTATAKRHGRTVGTLDVIFNNPSQDSSPFPAGVGIPNTAPTALVKDADITRLAIEEEETRLLIGSTLYGITRIDPDGTGMTLITLTKDF